MQSFILEQGHGHCEPDVWARFRGGNLLWVVHQSTAVEAGSYARRPARDWDCIAVCTIATMHSHFEWKSQTGGNQVRCIAGDPSPKVGAQDDSAHTTAAK